jgi:hypothetical protein
MTVALVLAAGSLGGVVCAMLRAGLVLRGGAPAGPYSSTCPTHGGFCYGPPSHRSCPL